MPWTRRARRRRAQWRAGEAEAARCAWRCVLREEGRYRERAVAQPMTRCVGRHLETEAALPGPAAAFRTSATPRHPSPLHVGNPGPLELPTGHGGVPVPLTVLDVAVPPRFATPLAQ